ncbi:putative two-component system sensor kinase (plasmid) [Acidisarcina polymorpha]|uniref:Putative two-component system sensor kinase n=1 Tax=Acidisarcina polymorpha TaxID=2211140 RepID=A0A2Z5GBL3_9BACT|nr:sensor histidine kinase [Acidisarcina polymorpha]AXC16399.1 putative two-component system sensor kinase [Acidisarcina polymorpha]
MSFFPKRSNTRSQIHLVALIALSWSVLACAQGAGTGLQQYVRAEWGPDKGLSSGRIQALAQTRDGYLWIGTAEGLFRFDGLRFVPILTAQNHPLPQILGLAVDRDGILWVRAADTRIRKVRRDEIGPPVSLDKRFLAIVAMAADQTSGIYATETLKSVVRLTQNHVDQLSIHLHTLLISISEASDRRLWIGTDRGLLSWSNGKLSAVGGPEVNQKINCLLPDTGGHVWVGTDDGLAYWDGHNLIPRSFGNHEMQHLQVLTIMEDREKNLWIGTARGLLRSNSVGAAWVRAGPSSERVPVTTLLQDREGDIWFGSGSTLERLKNTPIVPVRLNDSTLGESFGPIYVGQNGRVWFADVRHGLYWMEHGIAHSVLNDGMSKDEVYSIDGNGDDIWVGRRNGGLTRLHIGPGSIESKTWTTVDGLSQNSVYTVRVSFDGTVWAGTLTGGLNRFSKGLFAHVDEKDGLPANDVSAIELGRQGQVWIGTSRGVCQMEDLRCLPLFPGTQPAGKDVLSLFEDPSRGLWIGTSHGLFLADDHDEHPALIGTGSQPRILGLSLDTTGRLWIESDRAVMSTVPAELLTSKGSSFRTYGNEDGLQSNEGVHRSRSLVTDSSGQVWITTAHELAMIATHPTPIPIVIPHVEEVSADGALLDRSSADVPPGVKRLNFSFTGLDLHAPSRIRFRYRLDDFDKTWIDVVNEREATYTNLAPGKYTFRLIASNESNSWNSEESTVRVVIEPGIWQRWSVKVILAGALTLLVVFVYYTRTTFLLAQANLLADERLSERTRIARDVHDTLLQGFISSLMHLHVAEKQIPTESPLKNRLAFVLEGMEKVIEEARLTVVGLRTPDSGHENLEGCLRDFFQEISDIGNADLMLRSTGRPHRLKPAAHEDISAIAKEAILNALRHAGAKRVLVTIAWGWLGLKLLISDDGSGMDATVAEHGRPQHWGLASMRERAKQLKGRFKIESHSVSGTKITLSIPARIAYQRLSKSTRTKPSDTG